ncbi:MAG TPA: GNAT family N-acetyltransferase [Candidatus Limnocylindria bacterium]|nr:GNAT family N-acetyltransferase [Candidatus Limnocylindria bacterium]
MSALRQWPVRLARPSDIPELERLIALSVQKLQAPYYSELQRNAALGSVFGVDRQLIADESYFVVEDEGWIIGCGGWSRRRSICGVGHGPGSCGGGADLLDPQTDAARIRAYFVHPDWSRRGIARSILLASEAAIWEAGFRAIELAATLAGEPFYLVHGYTACERYEIDLTATLKLPVVRMTKQDSGS